MRRNAYRRTARLIGSRGCGNSHAPAPLLCLLARGASRMYDSNAIFIATLLCFWFSYKRPDFIPHIFQYVRIILRMARKGQNQPKQSYFDNFSCRFCCSVYDSWLNKAAAKKQAPNKAIPIKIVFLRPILLEIIPIGM